MVAIFKKILFCIPFVQLFFLISLCFYQHPLADDFAGFHIASKIGIADAIRSYLAYGTGRYFVVSVFILICSSRFLLDHYFIIPILFFIITYSNLFYFIREVWKTFFNNEVILRRLHWLTASCIILFLTSMEEVSTFFIWITTCCIFLLSFNVIILYARLIIRINFNSNTTRVSKWSYILLVIFIILLCGCEETTLFFSLVLNTFICYLLWTNKKRIQFPVFLLLLQLICAMVVFLLPGNRMRTHDFLPKQPLYFSLVSASYQLIIVFFRILSNPLFWFFAIVAVLVGRQLKPIVQTRMLAMKIPYPVYFGATAAAVWFFYFFIRHFGGRVVPAYANNLLICYVIIIFFLLLYSKSYLFNSVASTVENSVKRVPGILYLPCILLFIFSGFMQGLIQSLVTAPVHNKVYNDWKIKIEQAKSAGRTSVTFDNYQDACVQTLSDKYGKKTALFVKNLFGFPPRYIYTRNNAPIEYSYAAYYGIDTIYTGHSYIVSWDKAKIPLWDLK